MVTANQLHVSASNMPSTGYTYKEKGVQPSPFSLYVQPDDGRLEAETCSWLAVTIIRYTGCPRRSVPDFGRVFLMLKYTDITQNTYVQS